MVAIARKMQGRKPLHALPGIEEPFGGGRPNRYLAQQRFVSWIFRVFLPDRSQLGYQKGYEESGDGGKQQGAWESAEVGHP